MLPTIKRLFAGKRNEVDMTEGNIVHHLISFALPFMFGMLFQQLYNMVDTWVVGNYVSNEAFAAVGTVGTVVYILIGFFTGISNGTGVVISHYFGAKRYDRVKDTVHTAVCMTLILGIIFTFVGILMIPAMLDLLKLDDSIRPDASTYLTIYFAGVLGLMLYNIGSASLRAVGNSRLPLIFLIISAFLNVILDLIFVLLFHMGVAGVAYATVISQGISAILVMVVLLRIDSSIRISFPDLRIHKDLLKKIFSTGIPAAVQNSITSFSNVFAQSYIFQFGTDCTSGWAAHGKIDALFNIPIISLAVAINTFVAQNLGKRNVERAKQGVRATMVISFFFNLIVASFIFLLAPILVAFFNDKPEVIAYGTKFLRWLPPFLILVGINSVYGSTLRAAGNGRVPMVIILATYVGVRQLYLHLVTTYISNSLFAICMGSPVAWLTATVVFTIYYKKVGIAKSRIVEDHEHPVSSSR